MFILSFVCGHCGCFHFFAIMNDAPMYVVVQVFVWTCFQFLGVDLGVELLGNMLTLFWTFWGTTNLFSIPIFIFLCVILSILCFVFLFCFWWCWVSNPGPDMRGKHSITELHFQPLLSFFPSYFIRLADCIHCFSTEE